MSFVNFILKIHHQTNLAFKQTLCGMWQSAQDNPEVYIHPSVQRPRVCLAPALGQQGRGPHSVGWHAGCVSGGLLSLKWLQGPQGVSWLPGDSGHCLADCRDSLEEQPGLSLEGPWP